MPPQSQRAHSHRLYAGKSPRSREARSSGGAKEASDFNPNFYHYNASRSLMAIIPRLVRRIQPWTDGWVLAHWTNSYSICICIILWPKLSKHCFALLALLLIEAS